MSNLICKFRVEPNEVSMKKAAELIAGESSVGTWTEVKTMSPRIRKMGAKVFSIKGKYIKVAYPQELFEAGNMPQILSSVAGNIFGMKVIKNLRLEDIEFPASIKKIFKGPKFGIKGIRKLLKVPKRPLVGTIIKPKLGLREKEHAKVAYQAWVGGIDIVKDDENLSSMSFNKFDKRIAETLKMKKKAEKETGERKVYMPNVTSESHEMLHRAQYIKHCGGRYAMVDIITAGWSGLQTLRDFDEHAKLVLHAHRAGHAMFTRGNQGMSMLVIAKIARLIGVDQLHTGTVVGKMEGPKEEIVSINNFLRSKWGNIKTVFPVASGGLHPGHIPKLVKMLGRDIIIQAGGGVHGHSLGTKSGATAMRQAVDAVIKGYTLKEYSKKHKELRQAINKWKIK